MEWQNWVRGWQGQWRGSNRIWMGEQAAPDDDQPIDLTAEGVLDDRFLRLRYQSETLGKPMWGELLVGYDPRQQRAEASWVDSFHMSRAMLHLVGEGAGDVVRVTGDYFAAEGHPRWGWRIEVDLAQREIRMYNITPEGDETLGVQFGPLQAS